MTTNNDQLRKMFWELHKVPSRVHRLDETQTDELVYFGLKNTTGYKTDPVISENSDISVLTNLLIHQNSKFSPKKLPETVIDNHLFHTAMLHTIVGKETPGYVAGLYETMLQKVSENSEKAILRQIIEFLTGSPLELNIQNPESIDEIFELLKVHVNPVDYENLRKLLNGNSLPEGVKVYFNGSTKYLVAQFRIYLERKLILNSKTEIKNWLVKYFDYAHKGLRTNLNENTVWDRITENSKP